MAQQMYLKMVTGISDFADPEDPLDQKCFADLAKAIAYGEMLIEKMGYDDYEISYIPN